MAGALWPVGTAPGNEVTLGVNTYPPERSGRDLQNLFRSPPQRTRSVHNSGLDDHWRADIHLIEQVAHMGGEHPHAAG